MESGSKIVPITEPSCEFAASSSKTSLPGDSFIAANSSQNSLPGCSSLVYLHEEDVPGGSVNRREPSQLHVVELKRWLKCTAATTVGKKQDVVKL